MRKNHDLHIRVTRDFLDVIKKVALDEGYLSIAEFTRAILHERVYNLNRLDRLCRILENDTTKNTKIPNIV